MSDENIQEQIVDRKLIKIRMSTYQTVYVTKCFLKSIYYFMIFHRIRINIDNIKCNTQI